MTLIERQSSPGTAAASSARADLSGGVPRDTSRVHVDLLPFLALSVLLILIPGPDTAVVTKNAIVGGRRAGVLASVGVAIGLATWTVAAALGIAALLRASAPAFLALKLVGAVYLVWIGVQMLRARANAGDPAGRAGRPRTAARSLRQGLLSDLGNPKIAVFFTSFLPQFVHGGGSAFVPLLVLGAIFAALTLLWLVCYAALIGRASALMRRPAVRRALDRVTGVVLIGFGIRLAFEHR
jgi:RhtB (resistance to homoserine/threonine) family protein